MGGSRGSKVARRREMAPVHPSAAGDPCQRGWGNGIAIAYRFYWPCLTSKPPSWRRKLQFWRGPAGMYIIIFGTTGKRGKPVAGWAALFEAGARNGRILDRPHGYHRVSRGDHGGIGGRWNLHDQ